MPRGALDRADVMSGQFHVAANGATRITTCVAVLRDTWRLTHPASSGGTHLLVMPLRMSAGSTSLMSIDGGRPLVAVHVIGVRLRCGQLRSGVDHIGLRGIHLSGLGRVARPVNHNPARLWPLVSTTSCARSAQMNTPDRAFASP